MTWTGQSFSVGQVLTAAQLNNMQADMTALANGDAGAPEIKEAALAAAVIAQLVTNGDSHNHSGGDGGTIPYSGLSFSNNIAQSDLAANCTGQSEIKEATDEQSSFLGSTVTVDFTLAGGYWTLGYQFRSSVAGWEGKQLHNSTSTSYAGMLVRMTNNTTTSTGYVNSYYINSSPPYRLGYGDIEQFIFLLIDNSSGKVVRTYIAPEAPWHYNGDTDITPSGYNNKGEPYKIMKEIEYETFMLGMTNKEKFNEEMLKGNKNLEKYLDRIYTDEKIIVPIDQSFKNKDMSSIPHPFIGADLTGKTIVVLNPQSKLVKKIARFKDGLSNREQFSFSDEFFYSNAISIRNNIVTGNGGFHPSVKCVDVVLK